MITFSCYIISSCTDLLKACSVSNYYYLETTLLVYVIFSSKTCFRNLYGITNVLFLMCSDIYGRRTLTILQSQAFEHRPYRVTQDFFCYYSLQCDDLLAEELSGCKDCCRIAKVQEV